MAMTTNRMRSTVAYPPGHPRREQLRRGLRDLPATSIRINFESRAGRYRLLSYGTEPEWRQRHAGSGRRRYAPRQAARGHRWR